MSPRCRFPHAELTAAVRVGSNAFGGLVLNGALRGAPAAAAGGGTERETAINLYVGNLPYSTTSDELATLFGRVGAVTSAQVIMDRETGRSRGFGFVEMADEDARKAIDELTGADMGGRAITVNEARPRAPRPHARRQTVATERRRQFVMAPVSAPCTSRAYLPSTPLV